MRTRAQLAAFTEPDRSSIYNAEFSPSSQFVLASQDGTTRIWSLRRSDAELSPPVIESRPLTGTA